MAFGVVLPVAPEQVIRMAGIRTSTVYTMKREIARSRNAAVDVVERFEDFVEEYCAPSTD